MKRFLITSLLALAVAPLATGQISSTFNNLAGATYQIPPNLLTIDATNFLNAGTFIVNTPLDIVSGDNIYFSTSDTLNYTNTGVMDGSPGFDFGFFPTYYIRPQPGVPFNSMAANFVNRANGLGGGIINSAPAGSTVAGVGVVVGFGGATQIRVAATNLVNSGTIAIDNSTLLAAILVGGGGTVVGLGGTVPPSLISLKGENVDLSDGTLAFSSSQNFTNSTFGVSSLDSGVGTDTNAEWDPSIDLGQNFAISSFFSTRLFPAPAFQQMALLDSVPYAENATGNPVGTNTIVWRSIFLQDTSPPNVTKNVYFDNSIVGNGALHIEWGGTYVDPLTHSIATNYLYLSDVPDDLTATTITNVLFIQNGVPLNYTFTESNTRLLDPANAATPSLPTIIPAGVVSNLYSYLSLQLIPTSSTTNNIFGGSITNLPERIEISASRTLNLTGTQISGPDYLSLRSTNQFDGNIGVSIDAPFMDMSLGVTNGSLSISNLIRPLLPRWSGTIQAFTARWFVTANGITNDYRVLLVNSEVFPTSAPQIQDLTLHATNSLILSDTLNITRKLFIDARTLVLTTNDTSALASTGGLNIMNSDIIWSGALPNLKYLTNSGVIMAGNLMNFAGNMTSPYSDPNLATPYQAFVNHGAITNLGSFIRANYFVNDGTFQNNTNGNITLQAGCAFLIGGVFGAPSTAGNVSITANSLVISNHSLTAGGTLSITANNCFSDGFGLFNMFGHVVTTNTPPFGIVSNGNFWAAGGNLMMPVKPSTGDLLGTTISNTPAPFATGTIVWAGQDRGDGPAGYANNMAIGRLILNGSQGSKFRFSGTGPGDAIYIDRLELTGTATNLGPSGLTNIIIDPNIRVYYAEVIANGTSIAESLNLASQANGGNGHRFYWVSNYAGIFSSTNLTYFPSGITYTFNKALVESCNINSRQGTGSPDDDNVPNCSTPTHRPIPINWVFDNAVAVDHCDCDSGTLPGAGNILHAGHSSGTNPPVLTFPDDVDFESSGIITSNLFTKAQRTYIGLFYETNGVSTKSAGYFKGALINKGLSGALKLAGKTYGFSSSVDTNGHLATKAKSQSNPKISLNLNLQFDPTDSSKIAGTVTSTNWTSVLVANRLATNAVAGKFSFVIPGDDITSPTSPAGHGYGTLRIKSDGTLRWSGLLGDGASIPAEQSGGISSEGVWPLYYTPYSNAGLMLGWIHFDTNRPDSDLSGDTVWIKPGGQTGKNAKYYPAGFTNQIEVVGSIYVQPPVSTSNGAVVLSGGNTSGTETNFFILKNLKVNKQGANQFTLSITKSNGVFQGSELMPVKPATGFQGVLLQKLGAGYGFFLGTNRSGQVWYVPLP